MAAARCCRASAERQQLAGNVHAVSRAQEPGQAGPAHLASLGLHDLSATVLGALGQGLHGGLVEAVPWAGLGEEGQDGDACMAPHHRHIHVGHAGACLLCIECACTHLLAASSVEVSGGDSSG